MGRRQLYIYSLLSFLEVIIREFKNENENNRIQIFIELNI